VHLTGAQADVVVLAIRFKRDFLFHTARDQIVLVQLTTSAAAAGVGRRILSVDQCAHSVPGTDTVIGAGLDVAVAAAVRVFVALHQRCNRQETERKTVTKQKMIQEGRLWGTAAHLQHRQGDNPSGPIKSAAVATRGGETGGGEGGTGRGGGGGVEAGADDEFVALEERVAVETGGGAAVVGGGAAVVGGRAAVVGGADVAAAGAAAAGGREGIKRRLL
jgi:hypothetical protein